MPLAPSWETELKGTERNGCIGSAAGQIAYNDGLLYTTDPRDWCLSRIPVVVLTVWSDLRKEQLEILWVLGMVIAIAMQYLFQPRNYIGTSAISIGI